MTNEQTREIADAAIALIEARLKAIDLRAQRAALITAELCARTDNDCRTSLRALPIGTWCARCQRVQAIHHEYRTTAAKRAAALIKLKRLVVRRDNAVARAA